MYAMREFPDTYRYSIQSPNKYLPGITMKRRAFLKSAAATATFISTPFCSLHAHSVGSPWADLPAESDYWPSGLARPNYKILEIHLSGGLSPYETFHVDTSLSASDRWFGHFANVSALDFSSCTGPPTSPTQTQQLSGSVHLGAGTKPLWPFIDSMRVVVLSHDLEPHEAAIPYSLTGLPIGNPKFAGLGTAMEHHFDRSVSGKVTPNSYVLIPANLGIDTDSFLGFFASGLHGGQFQPLVLNVPRLGPANPTGRDENFLAALERSDFAGRQDNLLRQYAAQYRDKLRHRTLPTERSRSSAFSGYESALNTLLDAPGLRSVLTADIDGVADTTSCVDSGTIDNLPRAAIRTAANLLSRTEADGGARYVGLVDGGIRSTTGGGYDVHPLSQYPRMYTNLWNCLENLAAVMHRPASPAELDPNKINLNDTLVVLNTEFGRTPEVSGGGGRDHYPFGFVNVLIGGPITSAGLAGSFVADGSADPDDSFAAPDLRAGLLMAAGIDPFADENFAVGDVSQNVRSLGAGSEEGCARVIRENILGVI